MALKIEPDGLVAMIDKMSPEEKRYYTHRKYDDRGRGGRCPQETALTEPAWTQPRLKPILRRHRWERLCVVGMRTY